MKTTEQTLATAITYLSLLSSERPASLDDLIALNVVRNCVDELFRACVDELSTDPETTALWSAVASAVKLSGDSSQKSAKKQRGAQTTQSRADKRVLTFWKDHAERFAWDFLPMDFLHALYTQWMSTEFPKDVPLSKETFTRRLKAVAIASDLSGEWIHIRSRPGSLMSVEEPLLDQAPNWTYDRSSRAVYGLRRNGS